MKNSTRIAALNGTILLLSAMPLSAIAATTPKAEPATVFSAGANPEWSEDHVLSGSEAHIRYHADADAALSAWKEAHASEMGTQAYEDELRAYLVRRGQEHRAFHDWDDVTVVRNRRTATPVKIDLSPAVAADLLSEGDFDVNLPERSFEGTRPSARLLAESARIR